ncbi:beta strand repeat-containing protein [Cellulophaga sp. Asnod2-G02]|uniref:beta strand repeat-containing protein n=1 Tax=Cellulophaga sp. Asnod2-G02 TaxID=3160572 RepID=UPI003866A44E
MRNFYFKTVVIIAFLFLGSGQLQAQVKIGNNPQTINPSSLLELESIDKAFVVSRVTNAQMNAITPLEGAMVYNTEEQCIHYYDGLQWINICEAFGDTLTFTSEALENPNNFESVSITKTTDTNYNFEVGLLNASNIQDGTISTTKLVDGAVTLNKVADNAVNNSKIQNGTIQPGKMAAGLPNTILQTNASSFVEWAPLNVDNVTGKDLTAGDTSVVVTNGLGATLVESNVRVADAGISNIKLGPDAVTTDKILNETILSEDILDGTIAEADLADDAITNAKLADDAVNTLELTDDAVTTDKIGTAGSTDANRILGTDINGDPAWQDAAAIATSLGEDVTSTNGSITGTATGAALVAMDLEIKADDLTIEVNPDNVTGIQVKDDGITSAKILDETIGSEDILDGSIANADLLDRTITPAKLADGTTAGEILRYDGTDWVLADQSTLAITEVDGIIGNEVTGATNPTLTLSGAGTNIDPLTLAVSADGITENELADNAVTTDKITDNNVTLAKLEDGTAAGQLMQWDGTDWVLVDDSALIITEIDGVIGNEIVDVTNTTLTRTGTGVVGDEFTVAVAINGITTNELADDAVTTDKITDNNVTLAKLEDGTAAGQLMQWDGTDWVLVDDSALIITEIDGVIGNEIVDVTNTTLTRTGTGVVGDEFTVAVTTEGITANELADNAVTSAKIIDAAVSSNKILDGTIINADVNPLAAIDGSKISPIFIADVSTTGTLTTTGTATIGANTITNVDGTAGQLLTTDGAGVATWADAAVNNLSSSNLVQTASEDRTYDLNGSDLFFIGTGSVAIGPDAPGTNKLRVDGTTRTSGLNNSPGTSGTPSYRFSDDSDTGMFRDAADQLAFTTGGTEALRIIANQNVGIGTASPNESLHVANNMQLDGSFKDKDGDAGTDGQVLTSTATGTDWKAPAVVAMGMVNRNAVSIPSSPTKENGAVTSKLGTGLYRVTFTAGNVRADDLYTIQLTLLGTNTARLIRVFASSLATAPKTTHFDVEILDGAGAPVDASWYYTVTDF